MSQLQSFYRRLSTDFGDGIQKERVQSGELSWFCSKPFIILKNIEYSPSRV